MAARPRRTYLVPGKEAAREEQKLGSKSVFEEGMPTCRACGRVLPHFRASHFCVHPGHSTLGADLTTERVRAELRLVEADLDKQAQISGAM
eukprot:7309494-Prymnesium_polylepis.1